MKLLLRLITAALLLGAACSLQAVQPINVQISGDGQNLIQQNVVVGAGKSITVTSGGAINIVPSGILDLVGTTRGSILFKGANGATALPPGTSGYVLTSQGVGQDPIYSAGGGSGGGTWGSITGTLSNQTDLQTALNAKLATSNLGTITTLWHGNASGAGSFGAVALGTDVSGTLLAAQFPALTGDVTATAGSVATTIANNAVTNAKAAQMAAHTHKGNNTASTANALDLTSTQLTADLNAMVGDSGSGGTKGLAPAPAAGDAAAGKFLKADGTYAVPAGGSFTNPMTTVGDVIIGTTAGAPARLALGGNGSFLGVSGGVIGYYTPAGTGTVTHSVGALTLNAMVLGNAAADTKVVAGINTDGISILSLGVSATTAGKVTLFGSTSGSATVQTPAIAGAAVITLPNATSTLPIFGQQITFAGPTAARTVTFPDAAFTAARTDAANTFTGHQTIEGVTATGATGTFLMVYSNSPTFTGVPAAPTATVGTNTTQLATTAYVLANGGNVTGAASSVNGDIVVFSGTTGKVLQDTGAVALTGVTTSAGAGDSGKVPLLNGSGILDVSFFGVTSIAKGGSGFTTAVLARNALNVGETAITDAATILTDASLGNIFKVTLAGNRTLANPTNLVAGATYIWRFTQDATGSRTLAFGSAYKFPGGTAPTLTTTANAVDMISAETDGTNVNCTFTADFR